MKSWRYQTAAIITKRSLKQPADESQRQREHPDRAPKWSGEAGAGGRCLEFKLWRGKGALLTNYPQKRLCKPSTLPGCLFSMIMFQVVGDVKWVAVSNLRISEHHFTVETQSFSFVNMSACHMLCQHRHAATTERENPP